MHSVNYLVLALISWALFKLCLQEDRENVLHARESRTGVLTAPFRLLKTKRLGVILTFAVYKRDLPSNATANERIQATDGYDFFIKSMTDRNIQMISLHLWMHKYML